MSKIAEKPRVNPLYETDFFLWTEEQAQLLREKRWSDLDLENLIEEIGSVGASEKSKIKSGLELLMMHLLKWKYQPGRRTRSWDSTILRQRNELEYLLEGSPSLRQFLREQFPKRYRGARLDAEKETGIAFDLFPDECPFSLEEVMDIKFMPDEPGLLKMAKKRK
jgi:Domain of unknown function DUF29